MRRHVLPTALTQSTMSRDPKTKGGESKSDQESRGQSLFSDPHARPARRNELTNRGDVLPVSNDDTFDRLHDPRRITCISVVESILSRK